MPEVSESERIRTAPAPRVGALAAVVCLVAGILALGALSNPVLVSAALAVCAVIVAWGWAGTLGLPSPRGTMAVLLVGGLAVVGSVAVQQDRPFLQWVPAALAVAMIVAFLHQVLRRDGRPRVVESVSSVVLGLALGACGVLMVPPSHSPEGIALLLGALAAAASSSVTDLMGRWPTLRPWLLALAMVGGGAAAVAVALALDAPPTTWLLLGVAAGALSQSMRAVLTGLPTLVHSRPRLVAGVASVLVVGVVPYLVGLAFMPAALTG